MSSSSTFRPSMALESQYYAAKTVIERYEFYTNYFDEMLSEYLYVKQKGDFGDGTRRELQLKTLSSKKIFMSGLVHRRSDSKAEETAADEAYTRVHSSEQWGIYRFFTGTDRICFFKGNMYTQEWMCQQAYHPINDAQKVQDYLLLALANDSDTGMW